MNSNFERTEFKKTYTEIRCKYFIEITQLFLNQRALSKINENEFGNYLLNKDLSAYHSKLYDLRDQYEAIFIEKLGF